MSDDSAQVVPAEDATDEEAATQDAGGEVVDREDDGELDIEGPNSA